MADKRLSKPLELLSNIVSKWGSKPVAYDTTKDYLMQGFKGEDPDDLDNEHARYKRMMKEKIQDYVIINPKSQEHSSSKVFLNKKMLKSFLRGDYKEFFKTENFQRQYSYELPNLLWRFERTRNIGDYTLIFPNPDYSTHKSKRKPETFTNNWITLSKAKRIIEQLLDTQLEFPQRRKFLDCLKSAFIESFMSLTDYQSPQAQRRMAAALDNPEDIEKILNKKSVSEKAPINSTSRNGKVPEVIPNETPVQKEERQKKEKEAATKKKQAENQQNKAAEGQEEDDDEGIKAKSIRKILYGGDFYKRIENKDDPKAPAKWIRTKKPTSDFTTLLRQVIYTMLASQGLITREFVTSDGAFLVLVIYCPEANLKKVAQKIQLNKQLDITLTDLMSLEPIDTRFRPFRTNEALWNSEKWNIQYGAQLSAKKNLTQQQIEGAPLETEVEGLREDIVDLLNNKIKFKKIIRDLNGIWDRNDDLSNIEGTVYDHDELPLSAWENYKLYLEILAKKVSMIRKFHKEILLKVVKPDFDPKVVVVNSNKLKKKQDKYRIIKILSVLYRNAMLDSLNETNDKIKSGELESMEKRINNKKYSLTNLWNELNVPPFEASMDFMLATNKNRPRIRQFLQVIWKEYYYMNGESTHFTEVERLKCINWLVSKLLDLNMISEMQVSLSKKIPGYGWAKKYLEDNFFPLHDPYLLDGKPLTKIFGDLYKAKNFYEREGTKEIKVRAKFMKKPNASELATKKKSSKSRASRSRMSKMSRPGSVAGDNSEIFNTPGKDDDMSPINSKKILFSIEEEGNLKKNNTQIENKAQDKFEFALNITKKAGVPLKPSKKKEDRTTLADMIKLRDSLNQKFLSNGSKLNDPLSFYERIIYSNLRLDDKKYNMHLINTDNWVDEDGDGINDNLQPKFDGMNPQKPGAKPMSKKKKQKLDEITKSRSKLHMKNYFPKPKWPLSENFHYNIFKPWNIPEHSLREYFGEKITLFYKFYSFFITCLLPMTIIGLPLFAFEFIAAFFPDSDFLNEDLRLLFSYIFGYLIIIWSSVLVVVWNRKEKMFALKYGQINTIEEEKVRKNFKGIFVRSIVDDFMNDKSENRSQVICRMMVNYLIGIFLLCISAAFSIFFIYMKHKAYKDEWIKIIKVFELNQLIWNTLDCIKGFLINFIFFMLLKKLIVWENHKYINDHERSLINISFFFVLANTFIPYLIILFANDLPVSGLECIDTCFEEGSIFITTFVIYTFGLNMILFFILNIKNLPKTIVKLTNVIGLTNKQTKEELEKSQFLETEILKEHQMRKKTKTLFETEDEIYRGCNTEIERQITLNIYNSDEDFDSVIIHYIEIIISFSIVTLVGISFSLSFFFTFIGLCVKFIFIKKSMINYKRRPDPRDSGDIGHFKHIMGVINTLAIFTNSLSLAAGGAESESTRDRIITFLINLFFMITVSYLIPLLINQESSTTITLKKRQHFVVNKIVMSLNKTANTVAKTIKVQPNFHIYGKPKIASNTTTGFGQKLNLDDKKQKQQI